LQRKKVKAMQAHSSQSCPKVATIPVIAVLLVSLMVILLPIRAQAAPFLRKGSVGESVVALQKSLATLGYYTAGIDGDFGPLTDKAVRAFQSASGLVPDGIVGPLTWGALDRTMEVSRGRTGPLRGRLIVLDAGHGGVEPGAISAWGDKEKNFTLGLALKTRRYLEQMGANVVMTRYGDYSPGSDWGYPVDELLARVSIANSKGADIFVSIHNNAYPKDPGVSGVMGFYRRGSSESYTLASKIAWSVNSSSGLRMIDVQEGPYYVLNRTYMPAALIEVGFMTNRNDVLRLRLESFQDRVAQGIAAGIVDYFGR
jgi:N-acetylmuramoyl-L-alanine amidase